MRTKAATGIPPFQPPKFAPFWLRKCISQPASLLEVISADCATESSIRTPPVGQVARIRTGLHLDDRVRHWCEHGDFQRDERGPSAVPSCPESTATCISLPPESAHGDITDGLQRRYFSFPACIRADAQRANSLFGLDGICTPGVGKSRGALRSRARGSAWRNGQRQFLLRPGRTALVRPRLDNAG